MRVMGRSAHRRSTRGPANHRWPRRIAGRRRHQTDRRIHAQRVARRPGRTNQAGVGRIRSHHGQPGGRRRPVGCWRRGWRTAARWRRRFLAAAGRHIMRCGRLAARCAGLVAAAVFAAVLQRGCGAGRRRQIGGRSVAGTTPVSAHIAAAAMFTTTAVGAIAVELSAAGRLVLVANVNHQIAVRLVAAV